MANISVIGPSLFATLAFRSPGTVTATNIEGMSFTALNATALFGTATATDVTSVPHIREFPSFGTPANIVNVPEYGSKVSRQVQAQADLPNFEFELNYVPADHAALQTLVTDDTPTTQLFRLRLANVAGIPASGTMTAGTVHSDFYFLGTVAAFEVSPSLSDAMTATLTVAVASEVVGPLTVT